MSESHQPTFIDLCLSEQARPEDIDDFVDRWHEGKSGVELHDFLGMTWDEYARWVADPDLLPSIVAAHRRDPPRHAGTGND